MYGNRGVDRETQDDSWSSRGVRVNHYLKVNQHIMIMKQHSRDDPVQFGTIASYFATGDKMSPTEGMQKQKKPPDFSRG